MWTDPGINDEGFFKVCRDFDHRQIEIKFFWPLTEQIPLDLDYTGCDKPKLYYYNAPTNGVAGEYFIVGNNSQATWSTAIQLDGDNVTIVTSKEQPFYRRWLYKLLGIKLEKKQ